MSDRIEQLQAFVAVADLGSFTAAADVLGIAQSSVSKRIRAIEDRGGALLFRRTTRRLSLTPAGMALLPQARAAIAAFAAAEGAMAALDGVAGRIRITAPPTLVRARLMAMLADFQLAHPGVAIDAQLADGKLDLAREGIDLAVRVGGGAGERGRIVGTARRMLVAAPAYAAAHGLPQTVAELARHRCLTYSLLDDGQRWEFADGQSVAVSGPLAASDPDALRIAALKGLGIAASADWLFLDDLAAGRLVPVLPQAGLRAMPIQIIQRPGAVPRAAVRALADHLAQAIGADPLLAPQE